jgi:hypothetical protein
VTAYTVLHPSIAAAIAGSAFIAAIQVSAPPAFPLDVLPAATLQSAPVSWVSFGPLVVRFDETTIPAVLRAVGVGVQEQGAGSHDGLWVCYSMSSVSQRIWLLSDPEMGGTEHTIHGVVAARAASYAASTGCPELPARFRPISLDAAGLWLGSDPLVAERLFGKPSLQRGAWRHYESERTIPPAPPVGGVTAEPLTESGGLSIRIDRNRIVELWATKLVSS